MKINENQAFSLKLMILKTELDSDIAVEQCKMQKNIFS